MHNPSNHRSRQGFRLRSLVGLGVFLASLVFPPQGKGEARPLSEEAPDVTVSAPSEAPIGQDVSFTVTFDNNDPAQDVGYGPILDIILDTTGADGDDGLGTTTISASYRGLPFTTGGADPTMWVLTFDGDGEATHPLMRDAAGDYITVNGPPGDTLVVLRLPFGSFASDQPPAVVDMTVNMSTFADLGEPLSIQARGGYQYGYTPLDDWCCGDPGPATYSGFDGATVTPTLVTLTKTYSGPEDEAATGPNFRGVYPIQYTVTAEIAPGQSLTSLVLTDLIDDNLQFFSLLGSSPAGATCTPPGAIPGGTLECSFPGAVSGTVSMTFDAYVPLTDSGGGRVLPPLSGDAAASCDNASAAGVWSPLDPRDAGDGGPVSVNPAGCEHTLTERSIAIQKGVTNLSPGSNSAGDTLEYTLAFQVSDFFAFDGIEITDVISDGQQVDPTFVPTLEVAGNPFNLGVAQLGPANYDVVCNYTGGPGAECTADDPAANDGTTRLVFRVSDELVRRGQPLPGRLIGGCVDPAGGTVDPDCGVYNNGASTGVLRFRTVIQDNFADSHLIPPNSGDSSVDQGDVLDDQVGITGFVLNTASLARTGSTASDISAAGLQIGYGTLEKHIYALNGSTIFPSPLEVKPGDQVTYRITYDLPVSDVENLEFNDYLPLPVFHVDDPNEDGAPGPDWTFDPTVSAAAPPAGVAKFGPTDTFYAYTCSSGATGTPPGCLPPALSDDPANNRLRFYYGDFSDTRHASSTVDLLFTVTVSDDPFADRLYLTNQVASIEGSTNAGEIAASEIEQIILTQPVLVSTKGVIWTSNAADTFTPATPGPVAFLDPASAPRWSGTINSTNLAANPIDSNVSGVDAGDIVTFAITIENTGSSLNGAFDIALRDSLPALFQIPAGALNLQVYYGNGDGPIAYDGLGGGPDGLDGTADDLFGDGIRLVDPVGEGVCSAHNPNLGNNIILVTYDLQVVDDVPPGSVIENTSYLDGYAGSEGGPNHLAAPETDTASVTLASPTVVKTLLGTNQAHTTGTNVAIGEQVQYRAVITIPEGEADTVRLVDTLDSGLAFVSLDSLTASAGLSTSLAGGFPQVLANAQAGLAAPGSTATFDFGTLTNADRVNTTAEMITVEYTVVVLNSPGNNRGIGRNNSAAWSWDDGSVTGSAPNVVLVEPTLQVVKTALPASGDAGDEIVLTLTFSHTAASNADAFDVTLSDPLPAGMTYVGGSLDCTAGVQDPDSFSEAGGVITAAWDSFLDDGSNAICSLRVLLNDDVEPGQVITNVATLAWTSLPGDVTAPQSPYNGLSTERTGNIANPGGVENDYVASGSASVTILQVPEKSITITSESHTAEASNNAPVAIGEIVRYHLGFQLAEGLATNIRFQDLLPPGLRFIDDSTAMVAFVSNGAGVTSSTITPALPGCGGLNITGSSSAVTPTCPLPDSAVSASDTIDDDTYGSGTDVYSKFGNMNNRDRDADAEYVVVEFNALVENVAGNVRGTTLNNAYVPRIGSSSYPQSPNATVIVGLPSLSVAKAVTTTPSDAGDTLVYTITVTAAGGANRAAAFDLALTDTLDARLAIQSVSGSTTSGACGATAAVVNASYAGQVVSATGTCLNPGTTMTVIVTARVVDNVRTGSRIPNTAALSYTTLPGLQGTTPNPTGSTTPLASGAVGERTINAVSPLVNVDLAAPSIAKLAPAPAVYTVGDLVTWNVRVGLREGQTFNLRVNDTLPAGMGYLSHSVITTAAASGGLLPVDYNGTLTTTPVCTGCVVGAGGVLSFDFGTPQTNGSGPAQGTSANQFLVRIVAQVMNAFPGVQDGTSLTNSASLIYQPIAGDVTLSGGSQSITVIEPRITTTKSVNPLTGVQQGDSLTYTVRFANTGNSTAYDVTALDTLAQGVAYHAGSLACVNAVGGGVPSTATPGAGTVGFDGNPAGSWDIPAGGYIECTYTADALPSLLVDGDHTNTVDADWSSQDGAANAQDRLYNDSVAYPFDGAQDTDTATFNVDAPLLTKSDGGIGSAAVGQTITYTLTIDSPLGTLQDLVVTDTLPAGLVYLDPPGWSVNGLSAPAFTASGTGPTILTWDFGDALVSARPATITFQAQVANVVGNQSGTLLINTADLGYTDAGGGGQSLPQASDGLGVIEPALQVIKIPDDDTPAFGQTVTFTLNLSHLGSSGAAAYDLSLSDTLPAGLTYVGGSLDCTGGSVNADTCSESGGVINATWSSLLLGETGQISYQATVPTYPAINLGDTLTNTAALAWTSLPGVVPGERTGADGEGGALNDYADVTSATLTISGPDLSLTKDDGGIVSGAGQVIVYSLVVENSGNTPADNVTLSDDVPDDTVFDSAGSDAGWSCTDGDPPGTTCTNNLGTLDPGETQTVAFAVRVDDPLAAGVITVTNSAVVTEDGTHGPEPSLGDNTDSDSTPVTAVPDLQVTKDDSLSIVTAGQTLSYAVQYANIGEQDATGVVLTETVPVDTVFLPGSSTPGWACVPDNTAGSTCTLDIGDLEGGDSGTATFTVRVLNDADEPSIPNTIQIADDGTNGPDANPDDNTYTDTDRLAGAGDLSKILAATNQAFTLGSEVAIGELLTYQITVNVHPGTMPGLTLVDTLDQGLAFVECESIVPSAGVVTDLAGGFDDACNAPANPTVADLSAAPVDAGRQVTFSLGTVSNATAATGTLTIRYVVAVLDAAEVQRGGTLANSATLTWTGGTLSDSSDSVRVIEPTLALTKSAAPRTVPPGGIVTFTLEVSHAPVSDSPAFDLILEDTVPLGLTYVPGSLAATLGGVVDDTAAPLLVVTWSDIDQADTATVTFQATADDLPPGTEIENVADLIWSSLPGDVTEPQSVFNPLSRERVYDPGVDARITVTLPALPATGFAPGRLTDLPVAPAAAPYADLGDLWLEIPSLGLKLPIVGVPAGATGWDLTWLWDQAGYLEGTAFPTRPGNSALTGHVYLPDGQPGPFLALKDLAWGQRIIVHYGAARSIYEVRQVKHVSPNDLSPLRHEDQSWLTLITCEDYLAARDRYARRLVVRAVLVQVRD